jgi:hypothetical protein
VRRHTHNFSWVVKPWGQNKNRLPLVAKAGFKTQFTRMILQFRYLGSEAYSATLSTLMVSPFSLPVMVTFWPA